MSTDNRRRTGQLRLAGLILGLVGAGAGIPMAFSYCFAAWQDPFSLELAYCGMWWIFRWIILFIACIWPLVGGIILVIDSSLMALFFFLPRSLLNETPSLFFLLSFPPLLLSGILFLLTWRETRKASAGSTSSESNSRQD